MEKRPCHNIKALVIPHGFFAVVVSLVVAGDAAALPLRASIVRKGARNPETLFVSESNSKGLVISTSPGGANARILPHTAIDSVSFTEPEGWENAMISWDRGDYGAAAKSFGKLADDFAGLATLEDSYGARAKYFQIESLRRAGDYAALASEVEDLKRKPIVLGDAYANQLELHRAWGYANREAWLALGSSIAEFEEEKEGGAANPNAVPFKELPAAEFVQIVYLRGLLQQNKDNKKEALADFTRAVTLSFGAEKDVAEKALRAALDLIKADPGLAENKALQGEGHALAMVYQTGYGKGTLPPEYAEFANAPEPGEEEGEEAAQEEAESAEGEEEAVEEESG